MEKNAVSIRPFIGAKDYELSRSFYRDMGFREVVLSPDMCLFTTESIGFYLQNAYVQDWVDNTMVFVEVNDVDNYWKQLQALNLDAKYTNVRLVPVKSYDWGKECFVHDPSGVLWHFGQFSNT